MHPGRTWRDRQPVHSPNPTPKIYNWLQGGCCGDIVLTWRAARAAESPGGARLVTQASAPAGWGLEWRWDLPGMLDSPPGCPTVTPRASLCTQEAPHPRSSKRPSTSAAPATLQGQEPHPSSASPAPPLLRPCSAPVSTGLIMMHTLQCTPSPQTRGDLWSREHPEAEGNQQMLLPVNQGVSRVGATEGDPECIWGTMGVWGVPKPARAGGQPYPARGPGWASLSMEIVDQPLLSKYEF
ncbi:translation initiation factor IF-2-like isoform X6 [Talpa occidentalis]|uniref:translation initiation factor IF-2-like isoform X6 n=1 Tax=Talpa occidentalis TaxID=50954 RepID=UPI00188F6D30|nr:translation initiation factor IF-2-like isoform X6 [Talpa occidentalis]